MVVLVTLNRDELATRLQGLARSSGMESCRASVLRLADDPCVAVVGEDASSLVAAGREGVRIGPRDPATPSFGGRRLDQLLDDEEDSPTGLP